MQNSAQSLFVIAAQNNLRLFIADGQALEIDTPMEPGQATFLPRLASCVVLAVGPLSKIAKSLCLCLKKQQGSLSVFRLPPTVLVAFGVQARKSPQGKGGKSASMSRVRRR